MTAQIDDTFNYRGREYSVAGISEGELFDPSLLGLEPVGTCTACYRGYHAVFGLSGPRLVLETLHVNLMERGPGYRDRAGPEVNGVKPSGRTGKHDWFNNHYKRIDYHLEYTGGVLLADGFIRDLYVHMGFHPAWKYETVVELVFDAGVLKSESDRSADMAALRRRVTEASDPADPSRPPDRDEIARLIERAFDRRYDRRREMG